MISLSGGATRLCDGICRRDFLRIGALGTTGLAVPQLLRAEAAAPARRRKSATSCILFFLQGGQSQIETFDMKPAAPDQIRGVFKPIPTRVPSTQICEYLPKLAGLADKYGLIRSMTHRATNHNPAAYHALSGVPPATDIGTLTAAPDDHPHPGAVAAKLRPSERPVPTFVQFSPAIVGDGNIQMPGQNAGFLSAAYDPLKVTANPNTPSFGVEELALPSGVTAKRLDRRRSLLKTVEEEFPLMSELPEVRKMDQFYQRAYQMVTSPEARRAFDLKQEPAKARDRYGRNTYGQSLLLARRLVQAGVRLVTVYWGGALNAGDDFWDTHKGNMPKQKDKLLPQFDQCLSALLEDLEQNGLLDTTLVVSMGEFGRTPRIGQRTANASTDQTGRDHWPYCYSILLAGGGVTGGAVVGKSDRYTAYPAERPTAPEDLIATIYDALGVDWTATVHDRLGQPVPITRGRPVRELFG
jgi:uncharacterized protein (DUF1501 family)